MMIPRAACHRLPFFRLGLRALLPAILLIAASALAQEGPNSKPIQRPTASPAAIEKLVGQLGSADYRTREEATRQLLALGPPATEPLTKAARSTDLEVSYRAVRILESLLDEDDAADQRRAAEALESLAARYPSAVADLAGDVLTLYRLTQQDRAIEKLEKLGAVISSDAPQLPPGMLQVLISANRWTGKNADLELLKHMPNLGWVRIINVSVSDDLLKTISELAPAKPAAAPEITENGVAKRLAQTRLFELDLFGTGISEVAKENLERALPNVKIDKRNGALLGVHGMPGMNTCSVNNVVPNTAAAEADIRPGDEITMFDDTPIHNFEEFMARVSTKKPGDQAKIELKRGDITLTKELTLGRWEE